MTPETRKVVKAMFPKGSHYSSGDLDESAKQINRRDKSPGILALLSEYKRNKLEMKRLYTRNNEIRKQLGLSPL